MTVETYLAFDVGMKRTGVAIANSLTQNASALSTIEHNKQGVINWQMIDDYMAQYKPSLLIVGVPLQLDGQMQKMIVVARAFKSMLETRYQKPVVEVDEYLSSNEAKKQLKYNHEHKNAKRAQVDKYAAKIILQTWLNQ